MLSFLVTKFLLLIVISVCSGFCSVYLGVGGSLIIVSLLPLITGFTPIETLQISLALIFVISFINSSVFLYQGLVLWSWLFPVMLTGTVFSFASSFLVSGIQGSTIRLVLLVFLCFMLLMPFILKKLEFLKSIKGAYIFGSLMGLCVGLTGLGGGFLMSPYLHETKKIPPQNVSPIVCVAMFLTCFLAITAQVTATNFPFDKSVFWWQCYLILLISSIVGVCIGYIANKQDKNPKRRRLILRSLLFIMFVKVASEFLA